MSDHGGSRTPSQASDHSSLGIFEDEEKADEFITSLINSTGLQDITMRQAKRVGGIHDFVKKLKGRVDWIVTGYVPREEYHQRVETYHDGKITEYGENINSIQDVQGKLVNASEQGEKERKSLDERLANQESLMIEAKETLVSLTANLEQTKQDAHEKITNSKGELQGQADVIKMDIKDLTDALKDQTASNDAMKDEFRNLKEYMMGEGLQKQVTQLVDDRLKGYINDERMPSEQQKILAMVEEQFISKVREELGETNGVIDSVNMDLKQKDARIHQIVRGVESNLGQLSEKQIRDQSWTQEELEVRAKGTELEDAETRLHNTIIQSKTDVDTLRNRCISKLNEFVDHLAKIQATLTDHEHCLTHHAEELENRGTKYELLICQNRIDKCVAKEKYEFDTDETRRILDWQTTKIEAYGMNALKGKKNKKFVDDPTGEAKENQRKSKSEGEGDEEEDDQPPLQILHKQLECLAMGVIGLSSLVLLKDPGATGASRQKRLEMENDLLGHLKSVRHWITHRTAPGGWDPKTMQTLALKCTHRPPSTLEYPKDEAGRVLPQLKQNLSGRPDSPRTAANAEHNVSKQSTHMNSVDSYQSSTTWPESSRQGSRNLPIKSSREGAYATRGSPPGNVGATRQKGNWGRPAPFAKAKAAEKKEPEDFSGLFLGATANPPVGRQIISDIPPSDPQQPDGCVPASGFQTAELSTAEGFADMASPTGVISTEYPSPPWSAPAQVISTEL